MKSDTPYIYLFVRRDLSIPQQIIQTAHAVDSIRGHGVDEISHMVLIGAKDQAELHSFADHLSNSDIHHEMFFEPDVDAYTAIATRPLRGKERDSLKHFQLMR